MYILNSLQGTEVKVNLKFEIDNILKQYLPNH